MLDTSGIIEINDVGDGETNDGKDRNTMLITMIQYSLDSHPRIFPGYQAENQIIMLKEAKNGCKMFEKCLK